MEKQLNIDFEEWRPIKDYEGLYEVSNTEKIRSIKISGKGIGKGNFRKGNIINPNIKNKVRYTLSKKGKQKKFMFHIIVAKAFPEICGQWFKGCEVHHKDKNPLNNKPENLICLTKEQHIKEHYKEKIKTSLNNLKLCNTEEARKKQIISKSKPINQYTLDNIFIKKWLSCTECERQTGFDKSSINKCCLGKQKTSYGYIWKYAS